MAIYRYVKPLSLVLTESGIVVTIVI